MAITEAITGGTATKAGSLAVGIAMLSKDLDLIMVIIVGIVGGLIFFFKEWTHLTVKSTRLKTFAEFMLTIPMAISTSGVVFYTGTKVVNTYLDFGSAVWIFLALMASLHYKNVVGFFTIIGKKIINLRSDKPL